MSTMLPESDQPLCIDDCINVGESAFFGYPCAMKISERALQIDFDSEPIAGIVSFEYNGEVRDYIVRDKTLFYQIARFFVENLHEMATCDGPFCSKVYIDRNDNGWSVEYP